MNAVDLDETVRYDGPEPGKMGRGSFNNNNNMINTSINRCNLSFILPLLLDAGDADADADYVPGQYSSWMK